MASRSSRITTWSVRCCSCNAPSSTRLTRPQPDNHPPRNILDIEHQLLEAVSSHPLHQGLSALAFDYSVQMHLGRRGSSRCVRGHVHTPHLSADPIQLGLDITRRTLRQPEGYFWSLWRPQPVHGPDGTGPADTQPGRAKAAHQQEGCAGCYLCHRFSVSRCSRQDALSMPELSLTSLAYVGPASFRSSGLSFSPAWTTWTSPTAASLSSSCRSSSPHWQ